LHTFVHSIADLTAGPGRCRWATWIHPISRQTSRGAIALGLFFRRSGRACHRFERKGAGRLPGLKPPPGCQPVPGVQQVLAPFHHGVPNRATSRNGVASTEAPGGPVKGPILAVGAGYGGFGRDTDGRLNLGRPPSRDQPLGLSRPNRHAGAGHSRACTTTWVAQRSWLWIRSPPSP
jgi:hypothetical protein